MSSLQPMLDPSTINQLRLIITESMRKAVGHYHGQCRPLIFIGKPLILLGYVISHVPKMPDCMATGRRAPMTKKALQPVKVTGYLFCNKANKRLHL